MAGYALVFKADAGFRIAHHGAAYLVPRGEEVDAHVIAPPPPEGSVIVYSRDGLVIRAFLVDHRPIVPAFGFRIEYGGRVVVCSGDTRANANVQRFATRADVLIHEGESSRMVTILAAQLDAVGDHRRAKMMRDTITYHTAVTVDAARIAQAAWRKAASSFHISSRCLYRTRSHGIFFFDGVDQAAGNVPFFIGRDGTMLDIAAGSKRYRTVQSAVGCNEIAWQRLERGRHM